MFPVVLVTTAASIFSFSERTSPIIGPPFITAYSESFVPASATHSRKEVPTGTRSITGSRTAPVTERYLSVT